MAVPPLIPLLTLASVFPFLRQRQQRSAHRRRPRRRRAALLRCCHLRHATSLGGSIVWRSPFLRGANRGKYAVVLRPDGAVAIYGPAVWSTPDYGFGAALVHEGWTHALPTVKNVLFSSEMLYENAKLVTRDYSLLMKDDCNLVLVKASVGVIWQSGTAGRGLHCFLRLDHRGQLAVASDYYYKNLWSSNNALSIGDYVLLLQINGQAVVYGPMVWLTTSSGTTTFSSSPEPATHRCLLPTLPHRHLICC
ncbi:hypothetical protein C4D60_Mb09t03520 [Musa balbisiana]|uniref:Bulb-type lectin domain-containing protein n=1 Tax=Musa balbisiana TaxID=52838 RepID=A0A4S8IDS4_MUSBA|nr:hypothetical protein C4D60_Mb09t03520 [Musa balbisiana]